MPTPGTISVQNTVMKDGHTFVVHVLDPKEEEIAEVEEKKAGEIKIHTESGTISGAETSEGTVEKAEMEKSEKEGGHFYGHGPLNCGSLIKFLKMNFQMLKTKFWK